MILRCSASGMTDRDPFGAVIGCSLGKEKNMTENIEVFTQNSIRIRTSAGVIYVDPFRMEEEPHDADFVFITHDHYDHYSPEDIHKVCRQETVLFVPEKMKKQVQELAGSVAEIRIVTPGMRFEEGNLTVETIPAYNKMKPFHPKGAGWVGYLFETDGEKIYVAGDTDATKEASEVVCDVALVPVGGTFTMNAKDAAELINTIRPKTAIPVHYGSVVGNLEDGEIFRQNVKPPVEVELRIS